MLFFSNVKDKNNKCVTLQVRILALFSEICRKRVLSAACIQNIRYFTASITIEASIAFAIFSFAAVTLIIPMKMIEQQMIIQLALESVCEEFSQNAYGSYLLNNEKECETNDSDRWKEAAEDFFIPGLAADIAGRYVASVIDHKMIQNISFERNKILEDGENIVFIMDYDMKLPFPVLGIEKLQASAISLRRAWTGSDAKKYDDNTLDEEMVYIGKKRSRYHINRNCHYISNDFKEETFSNIENLKNEYGSRYEACNSCAKRAEAGMKVYILPAGNSYHVSKGCFAISSYVEKVPISSVRHLGLCSYCAKKGGG